LHTLTLNAAAKNSSRKLPKGPRAAYANSKLDERSNGESSAERVSALRREIE